MFWSDSKTGPFAAGMATEAFEDFVVGHGELWAALLFSATVKALGYNCAFMDTREVLVVTPTSDGNSVDIQYDLSNDRLDKWVQNNGVPEVIVATGFIAKNPLGQVELVFPCHTSCAHHAVPPCFFIALICFHVRVLVLQSPGPAADTVWPVQLEVSSELLLDHNAGDHIEA